MSQLCDAADAGDCPALSAARRMETVPRQASAGRLAESDIEGFPGRLFYHPRGWVVEERCFKDARFLNGRGNSSLISALDKAGEKLDHGCLGRLNSAWSARLTNLLKGARVLVACPPRPPAGRAPGCAATSSVRRFRGRHAPDGFTYPPGSVAAPWQVISLYKADDCMGPDSFGLEAVLFHETLHALGEDVLAPEEHDRAWNTRDARDRIYSAQAVCFSPDSASPQQRQVVTSHRP
ncbi:MAG: hypothetical protein HY403_02200 [Elusimicrobia bacterium]|nr:hypothetical protein [Elusimicrobiota bacterium]